MGKIDSILNGDDEFKYQMLGRWKSDLDYYFGNGNRNAQYLWAGDFRTQIDYIERVYDSLAVKPEWLTREDIKAYLMKYADSERPSRGSMDAKERPKDYRYLDRTKEGGYPISDVFQDKSGYLAIVFYRPSVNDWNYAKAYNPVRGTWEGQGAYCFKTREDARNALIEWLRSEGSYNVFDPTDRRDVEHEYSAMYNWNHVDADYLKGHDHRDPDFNTMPHSSFRFQREGQYDGQTYPDTPEGYRALQRSFRRRNQPERSMDIKGGKYAERRAKFAFWKKWGKKR